MRAAEVSGVGSGRDAGGEAHGTYTHAHTANGSRNVVLESSSFSISNAFVLEKSLFRAL